MSLITKNDEKKWRRIIKKPNNTIEDLLQNINFEFKTCIIKQITNIFEQNYKTNNKLTSNIIIKLSKFQQLTTICKTILINILNEIIKNKTQSQESYSELINWYQTELVNWINFILDQFNIKNDCQTIITDGHRYLNYIYFKQNLSNIITNYNTELYDNLSKCHNSITDDQFNQILNTICDNILNLSYTTIELLNIYINLQEICIKWKYLSIFIQITSKFNQYLKTRHDLITCLVHKISIESEIFVSDQILTKSLFTNQSSINTLEIDQSDMKIYNITNHTQNIIGSLLQIYGGFDDFITEYCRQLSSRLLQIQSIESIKIEKSKIQLLTKSFNDIDIMRCKIMMNDCDLSINLNQIMSQSRYSHDIHFEVFVITPNIWDITTSYIDDQNESYIKPQYIIDLEVLFENEFSKIKKMRQLEYVNCQSMAEVQITFHNCIQNIWCTGLEALILINLSSNNYNEQKTLSLQHLSQILQLNSNIIKLSLIQLIKKGIITTISSSNNNSQQYCITQNYQQNHHSNNNTYIQDSSSIMPTTIINDKQIFNDKMDQEIWPFIQAMLTNLGPLNIHKIYSSLKMLLFYSKQPWFTSVQLDEYLYNKIINNILRIEHNNYIIIK